MKTEAGYELQTYEPSGQELRIHWNVKQKIREDMDGQTITYWEANEALCGISDDRSTLISKIIGSVYTMADEIATINNKDTKPDEYEVYQGFRILAKSLADGWIKKEN